MKYRSIAADTQVLPWAHLEVASGQTFETDYDLSGNPNFVQVKEWPAAPAKEST